VTESIRLISELDPWRSQRLLPRMREIERMSHLMGGCPEAHSRDPGSWVRIAGRCGCDERVLENGSALPLVWADVIEHDAPEGRPLFVQGREERPHGPLRLRRETRPIDLHRVVHLLIAPFRIGTR